MPTGEESGENSFQGYIKAGSPFSDPVHSDLNDPSRMMSRHFVSLAMAAMLLTTPGAAYCLDDVDKAVCEAYPSPEERSDCYKELGGEMKSQAPQRDTAGAPRASQASGSANKYESSTETRKELRQYGINSAEVNRLYGMHIREWSSFTPSEKQTVAMSSIILMQMETADDRDIFRKHTSAAIRCMDLREHGMNMRAEGATVMVGITGCSAKTYRTYCTICRD